MTWYLLAVIGIIVVVGGGFLSYGIMNKQRHKEFEKRMPSHVASHPVSHNSIVWWYILVPIAAVVVGAIVVLITQG